MVQAELARGLWSAGSQGSLLNLDGDLYEGQGSAAQCLVFAEDQCQIAPDRSIGHGDGGQNSGLYVLHCVGAGDEADADIGGHKALKQLTGVKLHGDFGLEMALMKEIFQGVTGAAD